MSDIVLRTCTEIPRDDPRRESPTCSRPLAAFRGTPAYVLLGDPGSGKTTSFEVECQTVGDKAHLVAARDFITFDPGRHPEWRGKTLFLDGLDEVRAGGGDARRPLDRIRRRLDDLGRPRFRLSCREADWLGANDRTHLTGVSPHAGLTVLRLDPLTDDDIERILNARAGIHDPGAFMRTARARGVAGFLTNPQCLRMLAAVVGDGAGWPGSRRELFEEACRHMLREHNEEHVAAAGPSSPLAVAADDLLDIAGRLCAVLLLSGSAGCALDERSQDDDYPALDRCGREHTDSGRQVVATKLFAGAGRGRFRPVHRHVAEFLGARHLAGLVRGERRRGTMRRCGVPARRILALMTGHDGGVVAELRGLGAWLAALCPDARSDLVEREPIGVTLYGDAARFSTEERLALLGALGSRTAAMAEWLEQSLFDPARPGLGASALFAPDVAKPLRDILTDSRRDDAQQTFALFILRSLAHGAALAGMSATLIDVVRDYSRSPGVRRRALLAYLHHGRGRADRTASLKSLLADLSAGRIPDPEDALLGILLTELYPGGLTATEVWGFLSESDGSVFSEYFRFWRGHLVDESPVEDLPTHIGVLIRRRNELQAALNSRGLRDLPTALLARGLETHGDDLEPGRLYDWLGTGLTADSGGAGVRRIRAWLERRPAAQRAVLTEGLARCTALDDGAFSGSVAHIVRRLYGPSRPEGFGAWCVQQAEAWADRDRRVVRYFLQQAWNKAHRGGHPSGLSLHTLEERARTHAVLRGIYERIREDDLRARREIERYERDREHYRGAQERQHEEWLAWVRDKEAALRGNRGVPALLQQLAQAYFGHLIGAEGDDPRSRLRDLLRDDRNLEEAALHALREAIRRDDLPDVDEIGRLRNENQEHVLALPALASLAEIFRTAPSDVDELSTEQLRKGLAFHYCTTGVQESPWHGQVARTRPTVVAEVLVRTVAPALRATAERITGVHELAFREDHRAVAKHAGIPLLRAFPARGNAKGVDLLDSLLWSALRFAARDELRQVIDDKVARTSMNVGQRARWLAAGCVARPDRYLKSLERFVDGNGGRARQVAAFFDVGASPLWQVDRWKAMDVHSQTSDDSQENSVAGPLIEEMGAGALEVLVRMAAHARAAHGGVGRLIRALADLRDGEAGRALEGLASDPALEHWRDELARAREHQQAIGRDADRRLLAVEDVCRTLDDGMPANAADLASLTADRLDEIGRVIRNDNANGWRPFWNEDRHRHAERPKHEDSCRDALLEELRHRLPGDIDVQPEGRYANDKRADLRIACREFRIPVEIKKNGHQRLWSALRDQLMARYARDLATDGYGIYLVLWFGEEQGLRTPPPASGTRPAGPDALKQRLEEELTPEELRKISICVIDVSAPPVVGR